MAFFPLESAPLSLQLLHEVFKADIPDDFLHDFFRSRPDEPILDAWLLAKLLPPNKRAQTLLRTARMAQGYWEGTDGFQHLLFGVPLVFQATQSSILLDSLRLELKDSLTTAFSELTPKFVFCKRPLATEVLHNVGCSQLGNWVESLHENQDPAAGLYELQIKGAAVWVGLVSVPLSQRAALEKLFFTVNREVSEKVNTINLRIESLAEEQGTRLRSFPLTAVWNALSLSRLAGARIWLQENGLGQRRIRRSSGEVQVLDKDNVLATFSFPEELDVDIAPVFRMKEPEST